MGEIQIISKVRRGLAIDGHTRTKTYLVSRMPAQLKQIFIIIWILGVIFLCTLRTPVKYYQFYDRYIVIHTHIFSDKGKILAGQFILYMSIWSVFVLLSYFLFKGIRKNKLN